MNNQLTKISGKHGHPLFYRLLDELAELHSAKNYDYAEGGEPLGNFERVADFLDMYPNLDLGDPPVLALVYAMKQLDVVLWMYSNGHDPMVEGPIPRLKDIGVYALLAAIMEMEKQEEIDPTGLQADFTSQENENRDSTSTIVNNCFCGKALNGIFPALNCGEGYYWVVCPMCKRQGIKADNVETAIRNWNEGLIVKEEV